MELWVLCSVAAMLGVLAVARWLLRHDAWVAADVRRSVRRPATWLVGLPAIALVLGVGIPFVDVHILSGPAPKPLAFSDLQPASGPGVVSTQTTGAPRTTLAGAVGAAQAAPASQHGHPATTVATAPGTASGTVVAPSTAAGPTDPLAGAWVVGAGSEARYGVDDTAMGQTSRVVGRTHDVSGAMQIVGFTVTTAKVVVNMQTVTCGCVHDVKYRQMLETSKYPTSTFELTTPIQLPSIPPPGVVVTVPVTGDFTIHGVTRAVSFPIQAERIGPRIAVLATIPVKLSDYNVSAPNAGSMGGLSNCAISFLVAFDPT